jgi:hypothetical protein
VPQRVQAVALDDLRALAGVVITNSWSPGLLVSRIGPVPLPESPTIVDLLHRACEAKPLAAPEPRKREGVGEVGHEARAPYRR